MMDFSNSLET